MGFGSNHHEERLATGEVVISLLDSDSEHSDDDAHNHSVAPSEVGNKARSHSTSSKTTNGITESGVHHTIKKVRMRRRHVKSSTAQNGMLHSVKKEMLQKRGTVQAQKSADGSVAGHEKQSEHVAVESAAPQAKTAPAQATPTSATTASEPTQKLSADKSAETSTQTQAPAQTAREGVVANPDPQPAAGAATATNENGTRLKNGKIKLPQVKNGRGQWWKVGKRREQGTNTKTTPSAEAAKGKRQSAKPPAQTDAADDADTIAASPAPRATNQGAETNPIMINETPPVRGRIRQTARKKACRTNAMSSTKMALPRTALLETPSVTCKPQAQPSSPLTPAHNTPRRDAGQPLPSNPMKAPGTQGASTEQTSGITSPPAVAKPAAPTPSQDTAKQAKKKPSNNASPDLYTPTKRITRAATATPTAAPTSKTKAKSKAIPDLSLAESIESKEIPVTPTTEVLKTACWKCHVNFIVPFPRFCCYAMHQHPLLMVPTCSVCEDELMSHLMNKNAGKQEMQTQIQTQTQTQEESMAISQTMSGSMTPVHCSACGTHEDELDDDECLFLCDTDSCPHGMCSKCVSQGYGGGVEGEEATRKLQDEDSDWFCLHCQPTESVSILQDACKKELSARAQRHLIPKYVCDGIEIVTKKLTRCQDNLTSFKHWDNIRKNVETELVQRMERHRNEGSADDAEQQQELEDDIQHELSVLKLREKYHEQRMDDMLTLLRKDLDTIRSQQTDHRSGHRSVAGTSSGNGNDGYKQLLLSPVRSPRKPTSSPQKKTAENEASDGKKRGSVTNAATTMAATSIATTTADKRPVRTSDVLSEDDIEDSDDDHDKQAGTKAQTPTPMNTTTSAAPAPAPANTSTGQTADSDTSVVPMHVGEEGPDESISPIMAADAGAKRPAIEPAKTSATIPATIPATTLTAADLADGETNDDRLTDPDTLVTPSVAELMALCWKCHAVLDMRSTDFCCYAMYSHPHLTVPICCICNSDVLQAESQRNAALEEIAEQVEQRIEEAAEQTSDPPTTDETLPLPDPEYCSFCGEHEDNIENGLPLLMCDGKDCNRGVCVRCESQLCGGGMHGATRALNEINSDSDASWFCHLCAERAEIKPLQQFMNWRENMYNGEGAAAKKRTYETVTSELDIVEAEKHECQRLMEDDGHREQLRQEILDELRGGRDATTNQHHEDTVRTELEEYDKKMQRHEIRLCDMVSLLHDELETKFGIDLAQYYKMLGADGRGPQMESNDASEPAWKRAADAALERRYAEANNQKELAASDDDDDEDDDDMPEFIEDLGDFDDGDRNNAGPQARSKMRSLWRHINATVSKKKIEKILKIENERNKQNGIKVAKVITEKHDADEMALLVKSKVQSNAVVTVKNLRKAQHTTRTNLQKRVAKVKRSSANLRSGQPTRRDNGSNPTRDGSGDNAGSESDSNVEMESEDGSARKTRTKRRRSSRGSVGGRRSSRRRTALTSGDDDGDGTDGGDDDYHFIETDNDDDDDDGHSADSNVTEVTIQDDMPHETTSPTLPLSGYESEVSDQDSSISPRRKLVVAESIAKILKPHQKEGIRFMFDNTFKDLSFVNDAESAEAFEATGGCILAHNMGLGKSLSAISVLHALMKYQGQDLEDGATPQHRQQEKQQKVKCAARCLIKTVLLVCPVNTLTNWESEIKKWTRDIPNGKINAWNLAEIKTTEKSFTIYKWFKRGGILIMSDQSFRSSAGKENLKPYLQDPGPDVVVMDEAHTMLKNKENKVYRALEGIRTTRRICLTGSPFQNNLFEYFRMICYVRPGVLGTSETKFDKDFVTPIMAGIPSDAAEDERLRSDQTLQALKNIVKPYIHRKDATVLLQDLPPMQQVVLHLRQTKVQRRLYFKYKRSMQSTKNFFKRLSDLRPIHNHPGTLYIERAQPNTSANSGDKERKDTDKSHIDQPEDKGNTHSAGGARDDAVVPEEVVSLSQQLMAIARPVVNDTKNAPIDLMSDSESDQEAEGEDANQKEQTPPAGNEWWRKIEEKIGKDEMMSPVAGNKLVLLMHILVHATTVDDKVVVFSQCLKTLDFISQVLSQPNWSNLIPSLRQAFPNQQKHLAGRWTEGEDFLRIDGQITGSERGERIRDFGNIDKIRLFLISSKAGGIGINLCSANRVILYDSTFNPTITTQALYRCYRYGQKKSVFAYRFLTEGTIEEKIYSRAVTKTGMSKRLVDNKNVAKSFSRSELEDLEKTYDWVQCDKCEKWRINPPWAPFDEEKVSEFWDCTMNVFDEKNNKCEYEEKSQKWYEAYFERFRRLNEDQLRNHDDVAAGIENMLDAADGISDEKTKMLVSRDAILQNLLGISAEGKKQAIVSKHYFHDALLEEKPSKAAVGNGEGDGVGDDGKPAAQDMANVPNSAMEASAGDVAEKAAAPLKEVVAVAMTTPVAMATAVVPTPEIVAAAVPVSTPAIAIANATATATATLPQKAAATRIHEKHAQNQPAPPSSHAATTTTTTTTKTSQFVAPTRVKGSVAVVGAAAARHEQPNMLATPPVPPPTNKNHPKGPSAATKLHTTDGEAKQQPNQQPHQQKKEKKRAKLNTMTPQSTESGAKAKTTGSDVGEAHSQKEKPAMVAVNAGSIEVVEIDLDDDEDESTQIQSPAGLAISRANASSMSVVTRSSCRRNRNSSSSSGDADIRPSKVSFNVSTESACSASNSSSPDGEATDLAAPQRTGRSSRKLMSRKSASRRQYLARSKPQDATNPSSPGKPSQGADAALTRKRSRSESSRDKRKRRSPRRKGSPHEEHMLDLAA